MNDAPSAEAYSMARNLAFEALMSEGERIASYARSIEEAAFRGDELTVGVHLRQMRLSLIEMLRIYNSGVVANGPNASRAFENVHAQQERHGQDQRPGDGVA